VLYATSNEQHTLIKVDITSGKETIVPWRTKI
jgi:hypothetical protein